MYAIVDIAGQQFRVEKGQEIYVHRLQGEKGSPVDFHRVLFIEKEGKSTIGTPNIEGAGVKGVILDHLKADKLFVFKKKRRKGYQKFNGHRQYLSLVRIEDILETGVMAIREEKKKEAPEKQKKVTAAKAETQASEAVAATEVKTPEVKEEKKAPKAKVSKVKEEKEPKKAAPKKKASPKSEGDQKKAATKTAKKDKGTEKKGEK